MNEKDGGTICYIDKDTEGNPIICSLYDENGDVKPGKRLIVDTNAKDGLIFACIQELFQNQLKITTDVEANTTDVETNKTNVEKNKRDVKEIKDFLKCI